MVTNILDELANGWAEIQESLTAALIEYKESSLDLIDLMERFRYMNTMNTMNTMIGNVFANEWVRGNWLERRSGK